MIWRKKGSKCILPFALLQIQRKPQGDCRTEEITTDLPATQHHHLPSFIPSIVLLPAGHTASGNSRFIREEK